MPFIKESQPAVPCASEGNGGRPDTKLSEALQACMSIYLHFSLLPVSADQNPKNIAQSGQNGCQTSPEAQARLPATGAIRTEIARLGVQAVANLGKGVRWT